MRDKDVKGTSINARWLEAMIAFHIQKDKRTDSSHTWLSPNDEFVSLKIRFESTSQSLNYNSCINENIIV